jgi:hypothetical protein
MQGFSASKLAHILCAPHRERVAQAYACEKRVAQLRRQLESKGYQPFPHDVPFVDVARSALLQLATWLTEVGNAVRARQSKVRYGKVVQLQETAVKQNRRQAFIDNVKFFNILRPLVEGRTPERQLTTLDVLNNDAWLIDIDGAGLFPPAVGNTHQHFAFVNAAFGVLRVREEIVACQREMMGAIISVTDKFLQVARLAVNKLISYWNTLVRRWFSYVRNYI